MRVSRRGVVRAGMLVVAGLVLGGCKGSDSTGPNDSTYYLRFKANGSQVSFTLQGSLLVTFSTSGSQYVGIVSGFDAVSNANLQLYSNATIGKATYSGYTVSGGALVGALIGYQDATGTLYTSAGATVEASITVTDLTGTTMRGTFSGRLKATGKPDVVVTEGEFFVPRYN